MSPDIFKKIVSNIEDWVKTNGAKWLCMSVAVIRWKCAREVDGAFAASDQAAAYRGRFDYYSGNEANQKAALTRDLLACGRHGIVNPLVLCSVDWKRFSLASSTCLAYGTCVATYSVLIGKALSEADQHQK